MPLLLGASGLGNARQQEERGIVRGLCAPEGFAGAGLWTSAGFARRVFSLPNSNGYKVETEFAVTYSKQRTGLHSGNNILG